MNEKHMTFLETLGSRNRREIEVKIRRHERLGCWCREEDKKAQLPRCKQHQVQWHSNPSTWKQKQVALCEIKASLSTKGVPSQSESHCPSSKDVIAAPKKIKAELPYDPKWPSLKYLCQSIKSFVLFSKITFIFNQH